MRRATITIPDELERELESYLTGQDAPPSLTAVVQAALRNFLLQKRLESRQFRLPAGPFEIKPSERGSGRSDVSVEHDRHLAGES